MAHKLQPTLSHTQAYRHPSTFNKIIMAIDFNDSPEGLRTVMIDGRLDITGTDAIANRFTALTATANRHVLVDLSKLEFLASIGIRSIITNAKALQHRGGLMGLLVQADSSIEKTLSTTGIDAMIPMFTDRQLAEQHLNA